MGAPEFKRLKSTVHWFNDSKGYGWLNATPETKDKQIFIHYTAIEGGGFLTVAEGQEVEFDLIEGPKGPQAARVVKGAV